MHSAICWKTRVSVRYSPHTLYVCSENLDGAENQQERLIQQGWVIGFVDGEGCFSVGFVRQFGGRGRGVYTTGYRASERPPKTQDRAAQNPQRPYAEHPGHGMKRWSRLHGDMQGGRAKDAPSASEKSEVRLKRNSLSGKNYLPRRSARSGRVPAHIGEALPASWPRVIPREVLADG
jgi:hypothetical protein